MKIACEAWGVKAKSVKVSKIFGAKQLHAKIANKFLSLVIACRLLLKVSSSPVGGYL